MMDLAPLKESLNGRAVAVYGLARTGLSVLRACRAAGIPALAWDDKEDHRKEAETLGAVLTEDIDDAGILILSPGIPLTHPSPHPVVEKAKTAGLEIICDIELFLRLKPEARLIAITGTNGKSTTAALTGHILKTAGRATVVGGNIGLPILDLPWLDKNGFYVLEISSYQLDLTPSLEADIAVLINLAPDHLDRHGGMEGYVAAKKQIFRGTGTAVIGTDDLWSRNLAEQIETRNVIRVSAEDGGLDLRAATALPGRHNLQNALIAATVCRACGLDDAEILNGLNTYPGLPHRQYVITSQSGITYINDSKATNVQAAGMALSCYDAIYWIAGGLPKEGGFDDLLPYLGRIRHAFLIGEAETMIADWLSANNFNAFTRCKTLPAATEAAHRMARKEKIKGAVVLLSPACASWDQFDSFEHRGDVFTECVTRLCREAA